MWQIIKEKKSQVLKVKQPNYVLHLLIIVPNMPQFLVFYAHLISYSLMGFQVTFWLIVVALLLPYFVILLLYTWLLSLSKLVFPPYASLLQVLELKFWSLEFNSICKFFSNLFHNSNCFVHFLVIYSFIFVIISSFF